MPAYYSNGGCLATKLITLYGNNEVKGIPTHQGVVIQMDPTTGSLLAVSILNMYNII